MSVTGEPDSERAASGTDRHAVALNRLLYDENPDIDRGLVEALEPRIDAISRELHYDDEYRRNWQRHRFRLAATIRELEGIVEDGASVLDLGGPTLATQVFRAHFPEVDWRSTSWDLRLTWPCADEEFDCIVATEVFEHLSDPPRRWNEQMEFHGLQACIEESHRVLRPGGVMFASTPNPTGVVCLLKVLGGSTPMNYADHVREYSRRELTGTLEKLGFVVERMRAVHCLSVDERVDYAPLFQLLLHHGLSTEDRGDDWFVVVRRPLRAETLGHAGDETGEAGGGNL